MANRRSVDEPPLGWSSVDKDREPLYASSLTQHQNQSSLHRRSASNQLSTAKSSSMTSPSYLLNGMGVGRGARRTMKERRTRVMWLGAAVTCLGWYFGIFNRILPSSASSSSSSMPTRGGQDRYRSSLAAYASSRFDSTRKWGPSSWRQNSGTGISSKNYPSAQVLEPDARLTEVSTALPWYHAPDAPACKKIFLFKFLPWWGFASEYILYTRAAVVARKLGYTFIEDDRNWNYGQLSNWFEPRLLPCAPPENWFNETDYTVLGDPGYEKEDKLRWSRVELQAIDDWTRATYLNQTEMLNLLAFDKSYSSTTPGGRRRHILGEGDSLPTSLEEVFEAQADVLDDFWVLNPRMQKQVDILAHEIGLEKRLNAIEAPWRQNRRSSWTQIVSGWLGSTSNQRQKEIDGVNGNNYRWEVVDSDISQGGAAAGRLQEETELRGPVIGLHIRLGDKAPEYQHDMEDMGITNTFGNLTVFIEAAHDAYLRLVPTAWAPLSVHSNYVYSPRARPTLLVMTAEPNIALQLSQIPLAKPFRIIQTPPPDLGLAPESVMVTQEMIMSEREKVMNKAKPKAYANQDELDSLESNAENMESVESVESDDEQMAGGDEFSIEERDLKRMVKEVKKSNFKLEERSLFDLDFIAPLRKKVRRQSKKSKKSSRKAKKSNTKKSTTKRRGLAEDSKTQLLTGYNQGSFNSLPLLDRVIHTQSFVKDLTLLVLRTDAMIVSGASNIGRLAMLLGGLDATVGPRNENGHSLGGRIRSIDGHWYPTAYFRAMAEEIKDVEDLENAATTTNQE